MSSEEGHPDRLNITIEAWQPTGTDKDEESFKTVFPQLKAVKERHLRDLAKNRPEMTEEAIQKSLGYLEKRLRALKPGDIAPIAREGDAAVGYILVRWEESEKRTQIEQFQMEKNLRSRGTGSRMFDISLAHSRNSHKGESKGVFLTTGEKNEGAQRFYKERYRFHDSEKLAPDAGEVRLDLNFQNVEFFLKTKRQRVLSWRIWYNGAHERATQEYDLSLV